LKSKSLDIAWRLIAFTGYYLMSIGLIYLLVPQVLSSARFDYLTPEARTHELMVNRYGAFALITASICVVAIASNGYRRGERWAWWTILLAGVVGWGGPLLLHLTNLSDVLLGLQLAIDLIGVIPFVVGVVLPAKVILGKVE
jgi:hypothetical protein